MEVPLRLSPTSASRKLIALEFIKRKLADFGHGPSYREIAAAIGGASNSRVHAIVRRLEQEKLIVVRPGPRGIGLPDPVDNLGKSDILRRARALGLDVILRGSFGGTTSELPLPPMLDHIPDIDIGGIDDDVSGNAG